MTLDPYNYQTAVVRASNGRDALGRVNAYHEYDASGTVTQNRYSIVYNAASQLVSDTVSQVRNESGVLHTYLTSTANTWAAGGRLTAVTADTYRDGSDSAVPDTSTAFSYGWWDDARVTVSTHTPDVSSPGTTFVSTYYYDPLGRLASVDIADGRRRTASFAYTAEGQVLRRDERSAASTNPQDQYLFLGGMQVGFLTNNGNLDPIGQTYTQALSSRSWTQGTGQYRWGTGSGVTQGVYGQGGYDPINPANTDDAASRYTVRSGDTLGSIATSLWGDASLWYMLAEANGLSAASGLVAGQSLAVPNRVTNAHNSSSTFRPYDPNHALGDLSPTTPKTPKKNKCGAFGQILQAIVTVAVSLILLPTTGPVGSALLGNVAGQLFGMATGIQQGGFNFKSLAIAGITAGLTQGLSELSKLDTVVKGGLAISKGASAVSGLAKTIGFLATTTAGRAVAGMAINAATQGIAVAAHLQKGFDFAGVAAAGLSAGISGTLGGAMSRSVKGGLEAFKAVGPHFAGTLFGTATSMASALANAGLRSIANGTSFGDNVLAALPDVIGQSAGNEIAAEITASFRGGGNASIKDGLSAFKEKMAGVSAKVGTVRSFQSPSFGDLIGDPQLDFPGTVDSLNQPFPSIAPASRAKAAWRSIPPRQPAASDPADKAIKDLIPLSPDGKGSIAQSFVQLSSTNPEGAIKWLEGHLQTYGQGGSKFEPVIANFIDHDSSDGLSDSKSTVFIALGMAGADPDAYPLSLAFAQELGMQVGMDMSTENIYKPYDVYTTEAKALADSSITSYIKDKSTTPAASKLLTNFKTGEGPRYLFFGENSVETRELLSTDHGYYQRESIELLRWIAYNKYKTGDLREGYTANQGLHSDFSPLEGANGLFDGGVQMGDLVGTMKYGLEVQIHNGRAYFTARNDMDLSSFAGGNLIPPVGKLITLPKSGPFSTVHMVFQWSMDIPHYLQPK